MRPLVLALCLALLMAVQVRSAWLRLRGPAAAGPPHARRDASAVDVAGGIACVAGRAGGPLTIAHRLLVGGAIDPFAMSARDWEALPQIGPHRASALADAFPRGARVTARQRDLDDPKKTFARARLPAGVRRDLEGRLGLDEASSHDICSLGSWPTTSSGSDRPR